jgi:hypothetical protein
MRRFWILSSYIVATAAAAAAVYCGQACALQHCPAIATGWGVRTHCFSPYNKPSNEQPPILAYGKTQGTTTAGAGSGHVDVGGDFGSSEEEDVEDVE